MAKLISTQRTPTQTTYTVAFSILELRNALGNCASFLCVAAKHIGQNLLKTTSPCFPETDDIHRALVDIRPDWFYSPEEKPCNTLLDFWLKWDVLEQVKELSHLIEHRSILENTNFRTALLDLMIKQFGPNLEFEVRMYVPIEDDRPPLHYPI